MGGRARCVVPELLRGVRGVRGGRRPWREAMAPPASGPVWTAQVRERTEVRGAEGAPEVTQGLRLVSALLASFEDLDTG